MNEKKQPPMEQSWGLYETTENPVVEDADLDGEFLGLNSSNSHFPSKRKMELTINR